MVDQSRYDLIGTTYAATRTQDPRIARAIWDALGDASSVANIGAGTGNYEPRDREVVAIEPSEVMIGQRPPDAAPVIQGVAEQIPLADGCVDAAMAVLSDHHWDDCAKGLSEMQRIARRRVVVLTIDFRARVDFWLTRDYLTQYQGARLERDPGLYGLALASSNASISPLPIPADCADGFLLSFWRRPHAYLDPGVRAGISVFHRLDQEHVAEAMQRLSDDLETGTWAERNSHLLGLDELDLGLRLITWTTSE